MFIIVNSITIKIHSKAFHASFELWQLQGYSVNPNWQQSDLRLTRITDPHRGEVTALVLQEERMGRFKIGLIFKGYYSCFGDFLRYVPHSCEPKNPSVTAPCLFLLGISDPPHSVGRIPTEDGGNFCFASVFP